MLPCLLARESTAEQNNSHRPTRSSVRGPELYPPALRLGNSSDTLLSNISGTVKVAHVLERCYEDVWVSGSELRRQGFLL